MIPHPELILAKPTDAPLVKTLLDEYLRELNKFETRIFSDDGLIDYPYFDVYWSEYGRHPFIIKHQGQVIGFAFVRDPHSTHSSRHQIAEFYIKPDYRGRGLGRQAVITIWQQFPGSWELQGLIGNAIALEFWRACIQAATGQTPQTQQIQMNGETRIQFEFHISPQPVS